MALVEPGQRVLCLVIYKSEPRWLPGKVLRTMPEVGHVAVNIRPDYRTAMDGMYSMVVPSDFVFTNIEGADSFCHLIDKTLNRFVQGYDNSAEAWELKYSEPVEASLVGPVQKAAEAETPHALDSGL